jgi:hypothetical protein
MVLTGLRPVFSYLHNLNIYLVPNGNDFKYCERITRYSAPRFMSLKPVKPQAWSSWYCFPRDDNYAYSHPCLSYLPGLFPRIYSNLTFILFFKRGALIQLLLSAMQLRDAWVGSWETGEMFHSLSTPIIQEYVTYSCAGNHRCHCTGTNIYSNHKRNQE